MSSIRTPDAEVHSFVPGQPFEGSAQAPLAPPSPATPAPLPDDIRAGGPYHGPGVKRLVVPPLPPALRLRPPVGDSGRPMPRSCGMMNTRGIEGTFEGPRGLMLDLSPLPARSPGDTFRSAGRMTGINMPSAAGTWSGSGSYSIHPSSDGCAQMLTLRGGDGKQAQYRVMGATRDDDGTIQTLQLRQIGLVESPLITLTRK